MDVQRGGDKKIFALIVTIFFNANNFGEEMEEIIVTVAGLKPGEMWELPPDSVEELAETIFRRILKEKGIKSK